MILEYKSNRSTTESLKANPIMRADLNSESKFTKLCPRWKTKQGKN